jgi:hypothetical protein
MLFPSGNKAKGNIGTPQKSFYMQKLDQYFHLTLYNGLDQSGPQNQLGQHFVDGCFYQPNAASAGGWLAELRPLPQLRTHGTMYLHLVTISSSGS